MLETHVADLFERIVGKENVLIERTELEEAEKTNYRTNEHIRAILKPGSTSEVSQCLAVANEHRIPVYPVSKGKNWGYGSKVPLRDNSVLLDLGRLDAIFEHNDEFGYVTIGPGVTFQQLFDYLRQHKSQLLVSGTGGATDSSIIGNALERGIGTGLNADRFSTVCGLQAVLANGSIIDTGFGRFDQDAIAGKLYKWGLGPSIDGLFSQSNFGVITKLTLWLMKIPDYFQLVFYKVNSQENLNSLADELRELAMAGVVRPAITLYNEFRTFSTMVQYPWADCTPGINSSADVIEIIRQKTGLGNFVGKWNGEISIRSLNEAHGNMQYSLIEERIAPFTEGLQMVTISKKEIEAILQEHYEGKFAGHDKDLVKSFLIRKYIGIPDNTAIKQAYWRKRTKTPEVLNPDKDRCGIFWMCPIVPFAGRYLNDAVAIINETAEKYYFEPAISLQCLSERAINVIASINWDRDVPGEDEAAELCYLEMNGKLKAKGFYAYRNTTFGMKNEMYTDSENDSYANFLQKIKNAVDPYRILAPGRYNID